MNKQKCGKENAKGPVFKVRRLSRVIGRYSDIMQLKDCFHLYNKPNSLSIIARLFINTINAGYLHVKICRLATLNLAWIRGLGKPPEIGVIGPLYTSPGWFLARFESSQSALKKTTLCKPGWSICNSAWFSFEPDPGQPFYWSKTESIG